RRSPRPWRTRRTARSTTTSRTSYTEPRRHGDSAHRARGYHLPERRRVDVGVDGGPLHGIEQVERVDLQRESPRAAEADVTLEQRVQLVRAGSDDEVARRGSELA